MRLAEFHTPAELTELYQLLGTGKKIVTIFSKIQTATIPAKNKKCERLFEVLELK